jgi:hypothetical protein
VSALDSSNSGSERGERRRGQRRIGVGRRILGDRRLSERRVESGPVSFERRTIPDRRQVVQRIDHRRKLLVRRIGVASSSPGESIPPN